MMTKRERLLAAVAHRPTDRVPVALWRNWPIDNKDPQRLAQVSLAFQQRYDFDFVKISPSHIYVVEDYGRSGTSDGNPGGTDVSGPSPVTTIEQWEALPVLDPHRGALGQFLECLRLFAAGAGDTPFLPTFFSPMMTGWLLCDMQYLVWMRKYPDAYKRGLQSIVETAVKYVEACYATGAAGIFFAVNHASYSVMGWDEYQRFGVWSDMPVLEAANKGGWFNLLHIHGRDLMFKELASYPVQAVSWYDRDTWPSLREAQGIFPGALVGGLDQWKTLLTGSAELVRAEVRDAIAQTGGVGYIVGSGCQTPVIVPESNIRAAVDEARRTSRG